MIIMDECVTVNGMRIGRGNPINQKKNLSVPIFSTTDPTGANLRSNLGHQGGKLAIECLSCSTAYHPAYEYKKADTTVTYCFNISFLT
jgi:hypothetical protein